MGVSRWSDLGPFGPVWLCLIESRRRVVAQGTRSKNNKTKQIKNKTKRKRENRPDSGYIEGYVKYTKSSKVEREGRLL